MAHDGPWLLNVVDIYAESNADTSLLLVSLVSRKKERENAKRREEENVEFGRIIVRNI